MPYALTPTSRFHAWFAEREKATTYRVDQAPLDRLDGWHADPRTGNLGHRSGRFYSVEGIEVTVGDRRPLTWSQPIIVQPEIGIIGILVRTFNGVRHCLMQAKMEPGNINLLQLSPTVQATRSNFTGVHRGNAVPYLEYFAEPARARRLADSLQSEQGAWFLSKRNRNMVVEVDEDVPVLDGFCWLTVDQLGELLYHENLVNMDARSVLSVMPPDKEATGHAAEASFRGALARSAAVTDTTRLLSWFTDLTARGGRVRRRIPLCEVRGWERSEARIGRPDGRFFDIIGVDVQAPDREVPNWSQPLLAPTSRGVVALVTRETDGVLRLLLRARCEAGTFDLMELGPTVACAPANYPAEAAPERPEFLDYVLDAPPSRVRFDTVHSEEGGRFHHAENRYLIIEAEQDFPVDVPEGYVWATVGQATELLRHSHYLTMEARCLLACLRTLG